MIGRRAALPLVALGAVLALSACGAGSPAPTDTPVALPTETVGTVTAPEVQIPADALVVVTARVVSDDGAELAVSAVVRQATAWNDPAASDRPATMTAECSGYLDDSVYEANLWSFVEIDVTATQLGDIAWPSDKGVWVFPDPDYVMVAETGALGEDTAVDGSTPHCQRLKNITQPGTGTVIAGFQGDTDAVGAAGHYTRWANHNYGFSSFGDGQEIVDCELTVLPLAAEFGWSEPYESVIETDLCRFGNFVEDVEY